MNYCILSILFTSLVIGILTIKVDMNLAGNSVKLDGGDDTLLLAAGKFLFHTKHLSGDKAVSCSSCHSPNEAFQDGYERALSRIQTLNRNTPTLLNINRYSAYFWDGRANSLKEQLKEVLFSRNEINTTQEIIDSLVNSTPLLSKVFSANSLRLNSKTDLVVACLEYYIQSLVTVETKYSRSLVGKTYLRKNELRGREIFFGIGKCYLCHSGDGFTDNKFRNHGLFKRKIVLETFILPTGKEFRLGFDFGRGNVEGGVANLFAFRTASLINVERTAPYMHDGSFRTMDEVVDFYNRGGDDPSSSLSKLHLNSQAKKDLIAFLNTLTDVRQ